MQILNAQALMKSHCGTLLDDPLSAEHHIILVQGTNLERLLQAFCKGQQKVVSASEDQVIHMHANIAVDSPSPTWAAGNRVYDVVHVHIALNRNAAIRVTLKRCDSCDTEVR